MHLLALHTSSTWKYVDQFFLLFNQSVVERVLQVLSYLFLFRQLSSLKYPIFLTYYLTYYHYFLHHPKVETFQNLTKIFTFYLCQKG